MPSGRSVDSLDRFISILGVSILFLLLPCFIAKSMLNANSGDPDQTPRSVASDLGLHCLPISILYDARHKCVLIQKAKCVLFCSQTYSN